VIQYFSNLQDALLMLRIGVVVRRLVHLSCGSRRSDLVKRAPAIGRPESLMKHDGHPNIRASKRQLWVMDGRRPPSRRRPVPNGNLPRDFHRGAVVAVAAGLEGAPADPDSPAGSRLGPRADGDAYL
jgi:hypothetical protein